MSTKLDDRELLVRILLSPGESPNVRADAGAAPADDMSGALPGDGRMNCVPPIDPLIHGDGALWLALATL